MVISVDIGTKRLADSLFGNISCQAGGGRRGQRQPDNEEKC